MAHTDSDVRCAKRRRQQISAAAAQSPTDGDIKAALTLLQSAPNESLVCSLEALESLVHRVRSSMSARIFDNDALLSKILDYEGCLTYYHANYRSVVGWQTPLPNEPKDECKEQSFLKSRVPVCKKWREMIIGEFGLQAWKDECRKTMEQEIALAKEAANDENILWAVRIRAMAMADDVESLRDAYANGEDKSCGVGCALVEKQAGMIDDWLFNDWDENPFCSVWESNNIFVRVRVPNRGGLEWEQEYRRSFDLSIAHTAAKYGALQVLEFFETLRGPIWNEAIDIANEYDDTMLSHLVDFVCRSPASSGAVNAISLLLSGSMTDDEKTALNRIHHNAWGTHLHHAAARGRIELAHVLLESGMDPNKPSRCRCGLSGRAVEEHRLPVEWARSRGHKDVVELLQDYSNDPAVGEFTL